jgi:hypothetical protein
MVVTPRDDDGHAYAASVSSSLVRAVAGDRAVEDYSVSTAFRVDAWGSDTLRTAGSMRHSPNACSRSRSRTSRPKDELP